jgi:hypothetical protein
VDRRLRERQIQLGRNASLITDTYAAVSDVPPSSESLRPAFPPPPPRGYHAGMWVIVLSISVAVIFVAVLIWLTVRVINRRERRAKWSLAAMLSMPVLYLASWPAMIWLNIHVHHPDALAVLLAIACYPVGFALNGGAPDWFRDGMISYLLICGGESPSSMTLLAPALGLAFAAFCGWRIVYRPVKQSDR